MMQREDIIEHIKNTENKIQKKIVDAQQKKIETIEHAKKEAKKLENASEQKLKKLHDQILAEEKKEIEQKKKQIIGVAETDVSQLKNKAKIDKAKELFLTKFEEHINV